MTRDWQNWDVGEVAEKIEAYWRGSDRELSHRERLGKVVAPYLADPAVTVLEVGCGTGLVYERLVPATIANDAYTGVDVAEKMLAIARRSFPEGRFMSGDGYGLAWEDLSFDVVLCFEVLGHLPDPSPFVRELLRVARRTCVFTVWTSPSDDVVTAYEELDGVRFIHQQYADRYVRRMISELEPSRAVAISVAEVGDRVKAYVVEWTPGAGAQAGRNSAT